MARGRVGVGCGGGEKSKRSSGLQKRERGSDWSPEGLKIRGASCGERRSGGRPSDEKTSTEVRAGVNRALDPSFSSARSGRAGRGASGPPRYVSFDLRWKSRDGEGKNVTESFPEVRRSLQNN